MKRVIIASKKSRNDYINTLDNLQLGQVIYVGPWNEMYVKMHISPTGKLSDKKDMFLAINEKL